MSTISSSPTLFHYPKVNRAAIRARTGHAPTLTEGGILGKIAVDEQWLHRDVLHYARIPRPPAVAVVAASAATGCSCGARIRRPGTSRNVGAVPGRVTVGRFDRD